MGLESSSPKHKKSQLNQARIQGLYQMYDQSIRLSKLSHNKSFIKQQNKNQQTKQKTQQKILQQLMMSFEYREQYSWGMQISQCFKKHFKQNFYQQWYDTKELFYQLLLQNCGIYNTNHTNIYNNNHTNYQFNNQSHQNNKSNHTNNQSSKQNNKTFKINITNKKQTQSYEQKFLQVLKQRFKYNFRTSVNPADNDQIIDRTKDQKLTIQQELNFINVSIIDQIYQYGQIQSEQTIKQEKSCHDQDDEQYFLPLITKIHKDRKGGKLPLSLQNSKSLIKKKLISQIQMSDVALNTNYNKNRIQASSIILPNTVFYDRMNFSSKVQTDQMLKIYRQISNTIQQTINSCNLISCPLKHFLIYFDYKTTKKNISPDQSKSIISLSQSEIKQTLYKALIQNTQSSEIIRKKRQFNTNYLLKQLKQFTQAYTEFLFSYLNFQNFQPTQLQNFINLDTVYAIVLKNVWAILAWLGQRGYQWEETNINIVVYNQNPNFIIFNYQQVSKNHHLILEIYSKFVSKSINKIKIPAHKLVKAYSSLLKLIIEPNPQKYLKKIIIFYRQATACCEGADDLMTIYEFLLKNIILSNQYQQVHFFRMKNIIEKLLNIQSQNIDGAGEIVYAWTTWNITLQMLLIKLADYKKQTLKSTSSQKQITQSTSQKQSNVSSAKSKNGSKKEKQKKSRTQKKKHGGKKQGSSQTQTYQPLSIHAFNPLYTIKSQNPQ